MDGILKQLWISKLILFGVNGIPQMKEHWYSEYGSSLTLASIGYAMNYSSVRLITKNFTDACLPCGGSFYAVICLPFGKRRLDYSSTSGASFDRPGTNTQAKFRKKTTNSNIGLRSAQGGGTEPEGARSSSNSFPEENVLPVIEALGIEYDRRLGAAKVFVLKTGIYLGPMN